MEVDHPLRNVKRDTSTPAQIDYNLQLLFFLFVLYGLGTTYLSKAFLTHPFAMVSHRLTHIVSLRLSEMLKAKRQAKAAMPAYTTNMLAITHRKEEANGLFSYS